MKQVFSFYLLLIALFSFADMPGNKPRPDYEVCVVGMDALQDYQIYYGNYDSVEVLKDSVKIFVQGGFGVPQCMMLWGTHKKSRQQTDTLNLCSGDVEDSYTARLSVKGNHLVLERLAEVMQVKQNNQEPMDIVGDVSADMNRRIMYAISGISLLVLLLLVFVVWKRNVNAVKSNKV